MHNIIVYLLIMYGSIVVTTKPIKGVPIVGEAKTAPVKREGNKALHNGKVEKNKEVSITKSHSQYSTPNTKYLHSIEGIHIVGEAKSARAKNFIRNEYNKSPVKPKDEIINKPKRAPITNPSSPYVIHKPYLEAPHPSLPHRSKPKGTVANAYISSPHPYENNMNQTYYVYGPPENTWMCIHFDTIDVESGYDTVYVYDNDGTLVDTYSGAYGPRWSDWGDGPTFRVVIKSDGSNTSYGFDVNYIQVGGSCSYENSKHPYDNNTDESVDMYGPANDWIGELSFRYDSIRTETSYDYVYCYDLDDTTELNSWTGDTFNYVWSSWSSYNSDLTVKPHERSRLVSNNSNTDYGWFVGYYNSFRLHGVESAHNYPDNANQTFYVYGPQDQGNIQMRIHFSKLYTEGGYDTVYVYDENGNLVNAYSGDQGTDIWTGWANTKYMKIVLKSDGSANYWGFACDKYEWQPNTSLSVNLKPYTPSGWYGPLVISEDLNDTTQAPPGNFSTAAADTQYVHWAIINEGSDTITDTFYTYLYREDSFIASWYTAGLQPNYYAYVKNYPIHESTDGTYTYKITADPNDTIGETDETDNSYSISYTWGSGGGGGSVNLKPYTPSGWYGPLVISEDPDDTTQGPPGNFSTASGDKQYVHWAVINEGPDTITDTFYTYLYREGSFIASWYTPGLKPNYYTYVKNYPIHESTDGTYTYKFITDHDNTIRESDETDNSHSEDYTWGPANGLDEKKEVKIRFGIRENIVKNNALIQYELPINTKVDIGVYTVDGRLIKHDEFRTYRQSGTYSVDMKGTRRGIYFIEIEAKGYKKIKQVLKTR